MSTTARTVTMLLREWSQGEKAALDEIVPLVYAELHRLAGGYVARERAGRTLSPTDLVSEAYERLADAAEPNAWSNRAHFFAIAARTMRQILVDRARRRGAAKRGGGEHRITLDENILANDRPEELLALDEALTELAAVDERRARAVELHYFAGMTHEEIAEVVKSSISTVQRDLRLAHAWLQQRLTAS